MPDPLPKIKYYVKCGELEKWVLAVDPTNAAFLALCNADGDTLIDPYFFYVSTAYIPDIKDHIKKEPLTVTVTPNGIIANDGIELIRTDDILDMNGGRDLT